VSRNAAKPFIGLGRPYLKVSNLLLQAKRKIGG
jgi:hypothetical protein